MQLHPKKALAAYALMAGGVGAAYLAASTVEPAPGSASTCVTPVAAVAREVALGAAALHEDPLVELGRRLFFDPGASHSTAVSCASCHRPEHGFSDPNPLSMDDFGTTTRRSQPVLNLASGVAFHWDGEFTSIEHLVFARTGDTRTVTGGYRGSDSTDGLTRKVVPVAEVLAKAGLYGEGFQAAFGDAQPTRERLAAAVAAYVRTLQSTESAFDRFRTGATDALTPAARRGLHLFQGRAGCAQCHSVEGARPLFSDERFHNTGLAQRRSGGRRVAAGRGVAAPDPQDGRRAVSKREGEARAFKTPSLRDVALRAPYMHDASHPTLDAVVRYYALECGKTGDTAIDPLLKPFDEGKPPEEVERDIADLVAFLNSLTGATRAGLATSAWSQRADRMRLRLVDLKGEPYCGPVAVAPAGDPLPTSTPQPVTPLHLQPDAQGWIELTPFAATHVSIDVPGANLRAASGGFVPDTCREGTVTLTNQPSNRVRTTGRGSFR
jgi:cytochrome c peroxidase